MREADVFVGRAKDGMFTAPVAGKDPRRVCSRALALVDLLLVACLTGELLVTDGSSERDSLRPETLTKEREDADTEFPVLSTGPAALDGGPDTDHRGGLPVLEVGIFVIVYVYLVAHAGNKDKTRTVEQTRERLSSQRRGHPVGTASRSG